MPRPHKTEVLTVFSAVGEAPFSNLDSQKLFRTDCFGGMRYFPQYSREVNSFDDINKCVMTAYGSLPQGPARGVRWQGQGTRSLVPTFQQGRQTWNNLGHAGAGCHRCGKSPDGPVWGAGRQESL